MRSLSGTRNRIVLALAGLLILVAAVWLGAATFDLVPAGSSLAGLVLPTDSTVSAVVTEHRGWLLPAATAAAVVAALAGVALLVAQIPRAPAHSSLRLHDDSDDAGDHGNGGGGTGTGTGSGSTALVTLEPQVLERALAERVEGVPGIEESSVRVSGWASALRILAEVTVADNAQVEWAIEEARRVLASDTETALGAAPQAVDLLVHVRTPRSSARSDRVAVRHHRAGEAVTAEAV